MYELVGRWECVHVCSVGSVYTRIVCVMCKCVFVVCAVLDMVCDVCANLSVVCKCVCTCRTRNMCECGVCRMCECVRA